MSSFGRSYTGGLRPVCATVVITVALAACAEPTTPPARLALPDGADFASGAKSTAVSIAFSLNGPGGQNVFVIDTGGTRLEQVTFGGLDDSPAWSPERRKIAFVRGDGPSRSIYVKSVSGGREKLLGLGTQPAWSPDGTQIAFARMVDGNEDIYVMDADGGNVRRLTTDPAFDMEPHWAPDGLSLLFASGRTGTTDVFHMKPDGTAQIRRTFCAPSYYCLTPKMSPVIGDFRVLFYQGTVAGSGATPVNAIRAIDSNGDLVLDVNGTLVRGQPTWSPDGQRFAFIGQVGDADPLVYTMQANGTDMHWFAKTAGSAASTPAWSR